ncbi:MAG: DUF4956 domain-containing protein [Kiritimatiellae bacterium]|nr:DUF4956 domain-containing protein [Kiritimatiellia bacterium]
MRKLSMLDSLQAYEQVSEHLSLEIFAVALLVSLASSLAAAFLYRCFYEGRGTGSHVSRAFPLLGLSITTLFVCIQISIPLSLGLLGSLSIIRFRTPIKEPEEVGFIMLVIAASIAAATYNFAFLALLYLFALASLLLVRGFRSLGILKRDGLLVIALPASEDGAASLTPLSDVLRRHVRRHAVQSVATCDGRTSIQVTFSGLLTDSLRLQSELTKAMPIQAVNVFLDRPAGLR